MMTACVRLFVGCALLVGLAVGQGYAMGPGSAIVLSFQHGDQQLAVDPTQGRAFPLHESGPYNRRITVFHIGGGESLFRVEKQVRGMRHRVYGDRMVAETDLPQFLTVSPNGRYLYYAKEPRAGQVTLYAYKVTTGQYVTITRELNRQFRCSQPGGRWCAFVRYNHNTLYVLDTNTRALRVAAVSAFDFNYEWWQDDLYFNRGAMIYRLETASGNIQPIARAPGGVLTSQPLRFSVDSAWMALPVEGGFTPGRWHILGIDRDQQRQLLSESFSLHGGYQWSPSKPTLLFAATVRPSYSRWNLYLTEMPSGDTRQISDFSTQLADISYTWSPDGTGLVYAAVARRSGQTVSDVYIMRGESAPALLKTMPGQIQSVEWVALMP